MGRYRCLYWRSNEVNIYKLLNPNPCSYGDYISSVVIADSEDEARLVHPNGAIYDTDEYSFSDWCLPSEVSVSLIGVVTNSTYNAKVRDYKNRTSKICDVEIKPNVVICSNNVGS